MPKKRPPNNTFHDAFEHQPDHDKQQPEHLTSTPAQDELLIESEPTSHTKISPAFEHGEKYHEAGKRDVELYIRTYNTLLRSSGEVSLKALVQAHYNIDSSLHPDARKSYPDMSAFIYSVLRLPDAINNCNHVLLGQSEELFLQRGYQVDTWQAVTAPARRRKWFYDGNETLAVYVASISDTDDIVPILVAFQIEWNKIHYILNQDPKTMQLLETPVEPNSPIYEEINKVLRQRLHIPPDDWARLEVIWGTHLWSKLHEIGMHQKSFSLRMLGGSHVGYVKATRKWWAPVDDLLNTLGTKDRPVYFVSSNTHSIVNLLSGFAQKHEEDLIHFVQTGEDTYLQAECRKLQAGQLPGNWQNFLYFTMREWLHTPTGKEAARNRIQEAQERGIWHVGARHGLEIDAQICELSKLRPHEIDPRCRMPGLDRLANSDAIILNIDYPLGMAAYRMMREIMENLSQLRGIYILGKAATLNGSIGDVMISNAILDEHSQNTYWIDNSFNVNDVQPYLVYGSVLDNQKAVSAKGTYLQNRQYLDFYYRANYTVVEMESGPYLNAIYEDQYLTRYPIGENINIMRLPYELGILHYASDTPYTRGKNLGAGSLSYFGMDSTYASSVTIVRRILERELQRLQKQIPPVPELERKETPGEPSQEESNIA